MTGEMPISRFRCLHCGGEARSGKSSESRVQCSGCHASFRVEDGIVILSDVTDDHDYPEAIVDLVAQVEDRHFWFAARNHVILTTMRRALGPLRGKRVLDVGCGTGYVAAALENAGMDVWGVDMHLGSLKRARQRVRGPLFASQSSVHPFFPDFACATLLDVIEHLDDDVSAVRQAAAVLQANGFVVVTVPAGPHLWTSYDEVIGHKRRYDRQGLVTVLRRAGLEISYVAYFSCVPLLAQIAQRWMASSPGSGSASLGTLDFVEHALRVPPAPLNACFRWSIRAETPLRRLRWMRGGSLIAIASRRD